MPMPKPMGICGCLPIAKPMPIPIPMPGPNGPMAIDGGITCRGNPPIIGLVPGAPKKGGGWRPRNGGAGLPMPPKKGCCPLDGTCWSRCASISANSLSWFISPLLLNRPGSWNRPKSFRCTCPGCGMLNISRGVGMGCFLNVCSRLARLAIDGRFASIDETHAKR
jgi:hypothetical protein